MTRALLILRTPFQAWLAESVLKHESIDQYDLVYLTQNDSTEDQYYFGRLSSRANQSQYCFVPPMLPDIRNHLAFRKRLAKWFKPAVYDTVLLASIDALVPNALATRHGAGAQLITFDDGSANIYADSAYRCDMPSRRMRLYRRLFGALTIELTISRIVRHYTLHPGLDNIVDNERLRLIKKLSEPSGIQNQSAVLKVFIGQPFHDVLSVQQLDCLRHYLEGHQFDYYVQHPRESAPLIEKISLLDKQGLIAEDAIPRAANGRAVKVVGWFSTVLFNMHGTAKRTMLLFEDDSRTPGMAELAERVGCEVVVLRCR